MTSFLRYSILCSLLVIFGLQQPMFANKSSHFSSTKIGEMKQEEALRIILLHEVMVLDSSNEDKEDNESVQRWTARSKVGGTTRRTRYGVDVSKGLPVVAPKLGLDYDANDELSFSSELGGSFIVGDGFQGWWVNIGASWDPLEWLSIGLDYTRDIYPTDPGNIFGDLTNTFVLSVDGSWDWFGVSVSATHLPSLDQPATFVNAGISADFSFGNFTVSPSADLTFVQQRTINSRIAEFAEKARRPLPPSFQRRLYTDIAGVNSINFDIGLQYKIIKGLKITLTPAFVITPRIQFYALRQEELIIRVGLSYSLPF